MKKALSVLVSVLLVLSVLVGCSGNLGRKDRAPETTAASTPPTAPSEETGITNEASFALKPSLVPHSFTISVYSS